MLRTFKPGQVLYLRTEKHVITPGDVVVYHNGSNYIVHRVSALGR